MVWNKSTLGLQSLAWEIEVVPIQLQFRCKIKAASSANILAAPSIQSLFVTSCRLWLYF